jgi:hypothetical protein
MGRKNKYFDDLQLFRSYQSLIRLFCQPRLRRGLLSFAAARLVAEF